jgi:hypothetical protein
MLSNRTSTTALPLSSFLNVMVVKTIIVVDRSRDRYKNMTHIFITHFRWIFAFEVKVVKVIVSEYGMAGYAGLDDADAVLGRVGRKNIKQGAYKIRPNPILEINWHLGESETSA